MIVPLLLGLSLWFRSASDRGYLRVRDGIAGVLSDVSESLSGVRVVAGFNRQRHNVLHHRNVVGEYRDANDYTAQINAKYGASTEWIGIMGQAMLLLIGGTMVQNGSLQVGQLTAFILYLNSFFQPIQQLVQQYNLYQQGQAAIVKLNELLSTHPTVEEAEDAAPLPLIEGDVQLVGVSFGYDPAVPVLRDVDLHIHAGETMSFVGPTGAGKSTIAKLVTRFYDPTAGSVRIDGFDLRDVTIESLRRQLGVVPQEPFLFAGTVRDNIAFARPDATDDEVMEAVHRVGLDELVAHLPEGVDTLGARTRRVAVVGRAPAHRARARVPRRAARARARRGHVEPRPQVGDPGGGRPRRAARRAAPRSSWRTGCRPRCAPTASRWSTTAGSPSSDRTTSSSRRAVATPRCTPRGSSTSAIPTNRARWRRTPDSRSPPEANRPFGHTACQAEGMDPNCSTSATSATSCSPTAAGVDRMDRGLVRSCYHDDATEVHGSFTGTIDEYLDWVWRVLSRYERTQHFVGNLLIELQRRPCPRGDLRNRVPRRRRSRSHQEPQRGLPLPRPVRASERPRLADRAAGRGDRLVPLVARRHAVADPRSPPGRHARARPTRSYESREWLDG